MTVRCRRRGEGRRGDRRHRRGRERGSQVREARAFANARGRPRASSRCPEARARSQACAGPREPGSGGDRRRRHPRGAARLQLLPGQGASPRWQRRRSPRDGRARRGLLHRPAPGDTGHAQARARPGCGPSACAADRQGGPRHEAGRAEPHDGRSGRATHDDQRHRRPRHRTRTRPHRPGHARGADPRGAQALRRSAPQDRRAHADLEEHGGAFHLRRGVPRRPAHGDAQAHAAARRRARCEALLPAPHREGGGRRPRAPSRAQQRPRRVHQRARLPPLLSRRHRRPDRQRPRGPGGPQRRPAHGPRGGARDSSGSAKARARASSRPRSSRAPPSPSPPSASRAASSRRPSSTSPRSASWACTR